MPDYTLPLNPENEVNDINIEAPSPTPNFIGGAVSAANNLYSLPTALGFNVAKDLITTSFNPGKFLTSQEYDKSDFKVPGLSFPNGISQNVAMNRYNRWQDYMFKEDLLNNMAPGALSAVSRGTGDIIGMLSFGLVDVPTLAAAKLTTPLIGKMMPWALSKMEGIASPWITKSLGGALEGAIVGTPMSYAQYQNEKDIGLDPTPLQMLLTDGLFAATGGLIGIGQDWKMPIVDSGEHVRAREVAINHALEGKPAYVEPVIKNAVYQMAKENEPFLADIDQVGRDLQPEIDKVDENLTEKRANLEQKLKERNLNPELATAEKGMDFINRLERIREKPFDFRNEDELNFLKRFEKSDLRAEEPTILKKAYEISEKPFGLRTEEENDFFKDFTSNKEKSRTQAEINELNFKKNDLKSEMEATTDPDRKVKLKFKISDIETAIDKNKNRLDILKSLDDIKRDHPDIIKDQKSIRNLEKVRNDLNDQLTANRLYSNVMTQYSEPVSVNDLKANTEWVKDWRSDFPYSSIEHSSLEDEIEGIPDDISTDLTPELDQINAMREAGILPQEVENYLDNFEEEDQVANKISDSIRKWYQCLIGSGE